MNLNHIQLNTKNVQAACDFYGRYFGFTTLKQHGDGVFLWNKSGFMMAINPLTENPTFPDWFHIGFRLESAQEVESVYRRLVADGVPMAESLQHYDNFVFFRCKDPTGYAVEIFWEPGPEA